MFTPEELVLLRSLVTQRCRHSLYAIRHCEPPYDTEALDRHRREAYEAYVILHKIRLAQPR